MLIILFFLYDDDVQVLYVHFLYSYVRGNHELFFFYVYLVEMYVSIMTPPTFEDKLFDSLSYYKESDYFLSTYD